MLARGETPVCVAVLRRPADGTAREGERWADKACIDEQEEDH